MDEIKPKNPMLRRKAQKAIKKLPQQDWEDILKYLNNQYEMKWSILPDENAVAIHNARMGNRTVVADLRSLRNGKEVREVREVR